MNATSPTRVKPGPQSPGTTLADVEDGPPIVAVAVVLVALLPEVKRLAEDENAHEIERAAARRLVNVTTGRS